MTPEQRAKRAMFGDNAPFMDDDILTASHGYIVNYPMLVAAIRDALADDREAIMRKCEEMRIRGVRFNWGRGYNDACDDIAAAIRERPL